MGVRYECCYFAICWVPIFTLHDWLGRFSWVKRRCSCVLAKWLNLMPRELRCWTTLQRRYKDKSGPSWHEDISSPCARLLSRYRNTGEVWNLVWKLGNVIGWILVPRAVGLSCCRFVLSKFLCFLHLCRESCSEAVYKIASRSCCDMYSEECSDVACSKEVSWNQRCCC